MIRVVLGLALVVTAVAVVGQLRKRLSRSHTVESRLTEVGEQARKRWAPFFARAKCAYPPDRVLLVGLKEEKRLEVYAKDKAGQFQAIRGLKIQAASGGPGPKLKEGDRQVPEGLYRIESLNPNSRFHLSLRINYPNKEDRTLAAAEGRTNLGGDIMIHGSAVSIGCLAMGDEVAEDLFVLVADVGVSGVDVILSPWDLRVKEASQLLGNASPAWMKARYQAIKKALPRNP